MSATKPRQVHELVVRQDQNLVAVEGTENGKPVIRFRVRGTEEPVEPGEVVLHVATATIGSWSHLNWEQVLEDLERIRQESKPTPPIEPDSTS